MRMNVIKKIKSSLKKRVFLLKKLKKYVKALALICGLW